GRVAGLVQAVHVPAPRRLRLAVPADALVSKAHAPDAEEITEGELALRRRLDVHQTARVVRVQLGRVLAGQGADAVGHGQVLAGAARSGAEAPESSSEARGCGTSSPLPRRW